MKKILIKAYTELNLGDDLFIKILCDKFPNHNFLLVVKRNKSLPFKNIKNLDLVYRPPYIDYIFSKLNFKLNINNILTYNSATKTDATVLIGGSLFQQNNDNWKVDADYYNNLVEKSNEFFILGSNFGPYYDESFYGFYYDMFKRVNDICFRDQYSYNNFLNLPQVRIAPDVVFSLDTNLVGSFESKGYIIISIIDLSWREDLKPYIEEYENKLLQISESLISYGYEVIFMSFCKNEGDEQAISRIMSKMKSPKAQKYFYRGNLEESLTIIKSSVGVIATRFHSLILAWNFNKPVYPFSYNKKTVNVLNDVNFDGDWCDIKEIEKLNINTVVKQMCSSPSQNFSKQKDDSEKQFVKLDAFLNN